MTRKPARMYRKVEGQIYTRQEYMGGIPNCRITQFDTGNLSATFPFALSLGTEEAAQVRDIALEAARISAVRVLEKAAPNEFRLKVRRFPHQVLREHKMATGAGADRISDGMRRAFGKPVGHAVRAEIGAELMTVYTTESHIPDAKEALRKAAHKLPVPTRLLVSGTVTPAAG
jgi:large subunit ribosomal protein L10e